MTEIHDPLFGPAAERWRRAVDALPEGLARCRVPDGASCSPTFQRWAREVLPPVGGSVLDVGGGDGGRALALVPPANEVVVVDPSGAALDRFVGDAARAGVARRTVHGTWPDVAPFAPRADVVACGSLLYGVADVVPFVLALTGRARLAVVVEVPERHPIDLWRRCLAQIGGPDVPSVPTADDLVAVLDELGLAPERERGSADSPDPAIGGSVRDFARECLGVGDEGLDEFGRWLAEHPLPRSLATVVLRWPGAAEPD